MAALVAAAAIAGGCQPVVLDPDGNTDQSAVDGQPPNTNALVFRLGDLPHKPHDSVTVSYDSPDTLVFFFNQDNPVTCAAPDAHLWTQRPHPLCQAHQTLEFALPRELFHLGKVDLRDQRIQLFFDFGDGQCDGVGGIDEGYQGTLEILDISPGSIEVNLQLDENSYVPGLSGHYLVDGCSGLPAESPPSPAVAVLGANLPPDAIEDEVDPTALYVFAGDDRSTCDSPAPDLTCSRRLRSVFAIPGGSVETGSFVLADLGASYEVAELTAVCGEDIEGGRFERGTVTIDRVDADVLSFRIADTSNRRLDSTSGRWLNVDGVFAAKLCP